jgi:hypothetical protein
MWRTDTPRDVTVGFEGYERKVGRQRRSLFVANQLQSPNAEREVRPLTATLSASVFADTRRAIICPRMIIGGYQTERLRAPQRSLHCIRFTAEVRKTGEYGYRNYAQQFTSGSGLRARRPRLMHSRPRGQWAVHPSPFMRRCARLLRASPRCGQMCPSARAPPCARSRAPNSRKIRGMAGSDNEPARRRRLLHLELSGHDA